MFSDGYFWLGLVIGAGIIIYYVSRNKACKNIGFKNAVNLAEELMNAYRTRDLEGIESFKEDYLKRDQMFILRKKAYPSPYQLWAAIVIYVAHRYADYEFNPYDSKEWTDIVAKTFGNKSIGLSKFKAVDEILNRSTKHFMSSSGWLKNDSERNWRGGIGDFGDDGLYEMVVNIIESSFDHVISFEKYSEVEEPEDNYDRGAYALALMNFESHNNVEGIKNLEKAALSGLPEAQTRLGFIYFKGERVRKNEELAYQWFLKGAESGDPVAMFLVGQAYYHGSRFEKDLDKAVFWLQKSVDKEYVQAESLLGILYLNGEGVEKNPAKGYELLVKAADKEDAHSMFTLAMMYARGVDIEFDEEKALSWFDKAISNDESYEELRPELMKFIDRHKV